MNRDEALKHVKTLEPDFLERVGTVGGFPSYRCPVCGYDGGTGDHKGTGLVRDKSSETPRWKCFSCNEPSMDIVALWKAHTQVTDDRKAFATLYEHYGLTIDSFQTGARRTYQNNAKTGQPAPSRTEEPSYVDFCRRCATRIEQTDYHRGISLETLKRFNVGFDPNWKHPSQASNPNAPQTPRLIIPTSPHSYVARDTRAEIPEKQKRFKKMKAGKVRIFNAQALYSARQPVFVVEGELDALSIIDTGGEAIGLGGTSSISSLLEMLKEKRPVQPLLLALDVDAAGATGQQKLEDGLRGMDVSFYRLDGFSAPYKDANAWLCAQRDAFSCAVRDAVEKAVRIEEKRLEAERKAQREALERESAAFGIESFLINVEKSAVPAIPTGFRDLDALLGGGLYAGLYAVGAVSSLGKTTLGLQIADQAAQNGHDVLIFSLEMARQELIAKSLSRLTYLLAQRDGLDTGLAKTTRGVLAGSRYNFYSEEETVLLWRAVDVYSEYAGHVFITEGVGNVGTNEIRSRVERHAKITGKAPVVLIDYLQIIAPAMEDARATDKQITDKNILALKRVSRDFNIPVIGISSFNRDNYLHPVNLASFKESGAIEYSSDVLIGLQLNGMDYQAGESGTGRDKRIRELIDKATQDGREGRAQKIQVKLLKHRNGSKGSCVLDFCPMFNCFMDSDGEDSGWIRTA